MNVYKGHSAGKNKEDHLTQNKKKDQFPVEQKPAVPAFRSIGTPAVQKKEDIIEEEQGRFIPAEQKATTSLPGKNNVDTAGTVFNPVQKKNGTVAGRGGDTLASGYEHFNGLDISAVRAHTIGSVVQRQKTIQLVIDPLTGKEIPASTVTDSSTGALQEETKVNLGGPKTEAAASSATDEGVVADHRAGEEKVPDKVPGSGDASPVKTKESESAGDGVRTPGSETPAISVSSVGSGPVTDVAKVKPGVPGAGAPVKRAPVTVATSSSLFDGPVETKEQSGETKEIKSKPEQLYAEIKRIRKLKDPRLKCEALWSFFGYGKDEHPAADDKAFTGMYDVCLADLGKVVMKINPETKEREPLSVEPHHILSVLSSCGGTQQTLMKKVFGERGGMAKDLEFESMPRVSLSNNTFKEEDKLKTQTVGDFIEKLNPPGSVAMFKIATGGFGHAFTIMHDSRTSWWHRGKYYLLQGDVGKLNLLDIKGTKKFTKEKLRKFLNAATIGQAASKPEHYFFASDLSKSEMVFKVFKS